MRQSGFITVLILIIVLIIVITTGGIYFYKTRSLSVLSPKSKSSPISNTSITPHKASSTSTPTPAIPFDIGEGTICQPNPTNQKYVITDGNLYEISVSNTRTLLIDKKEAIAINGDTYLNFDNFCLSPDNSKILLSAQGQLTIRFIYYSSLNKINLIYIHNADQAEWSHNSRYIAYTSRVADAGGDYVLGVYDTNLNKGLSLTQQPSIPNIKNSALSYSILSWQDDDSGIKVHYTAQESAPYGKILGEGQLVIPLTSFATAQ